MTARVLSGGMTTSMQCISNTKVSPSALQPKATLANTPAQRKPGTIFRHSLAGTVAFSARYWTAGIRLKGSLAACSLGLAPAKTDSTCTPGQRATCTTPLLCYRTLLRCSTARDTRPLRNYQAWTPNTSCASTRTGRHLSDFASRRQNKTVNEQPGPGRAAACAFTRRTPGPLI